VKARILSGLALCAVVVFVMVGCKSEPPAPPPPPVAPAPVPVAPPPPPPVVVPPPPPATPLVPVAEETAAPEEGGKGGGNVDKALPGKETTGEELAGPYQCMVDMKFGPIKAPSFGCSIKAKEGGGYKVGPARENAAAGVLKGDITNSTTAGFMLVAKYTYSGQNLEIKGRLLRQGTKETYSGKCRGVLNGDKSTAQDYKVSMTKQQ
jgi:hypothetical protein